MKILFFDCETTGVPKNYNASYEDVDNWPRVIALAWILVRDNGTVISSSHKLIKPDGWQMPTEKFWIDNGFSHAKNLAEGYPIAEVLSEMMEAKLQANLLVAHNLNFDHRVVWAEFIRAGIKPRSGMNKLCTMMKSTSYCKLPGTRGFKWPKLEELYEVLFAKKMDGAHDAMKDITATKDCFFELLRRKVIELPTEQIA
jgi:DNA polymerase III subunit epsilon